MSIDERLRDAADRLNTRLEQTPVPEPPGRARTPLRAVAATAVVTLIAVGSMTWLLGSGGDPAATDPDTADRRDRPVFREPTDSVLLFDDGYDGVLAVDPDERLAAHSAVEGKRAGDRVPRIHRSGDHLVVGRGEITAVDIETGGATPLGAATNAVPAVEPGRVWMVAPGDEAPGVEGPGGEGADGLVWQVVVATGRALSEPIPLDVEGTPVAGVAGGLALATDDGVALWYPGEGVERRLGEGEGLGRVVDVHRNRIAWCVSGRDTLQVTDIYGRDHVHPGPCPERARFSPDGRLLAFADEEWVHVFDVQAETVDRLGPLDMNMPIYLGWSPDGEQLFAATYGWGEERIQVLRHRIGDGRTDIAVLSVGGTLGFVVLDAAEAGRYFDSGLDDECPPPGAGEQPREICTFEL